MSRARMATSSASAADRPQANNRLHIVRVRNTLRRLSTLGYRKSIATLCSECGSLAGLARFLRLLKETEHFHHWRQEQVAKIVQCGEPRILRKVLKGSLVEVAPAHA